LEFTETHTKHIKNTTTQAKPIKVEPKGAGINKRRYPSQPEHQVMSSVAQTKYRYIRQPWVFSPPTLLGKTITTQEMNETNTTDKYPTEARRSHLRRH
jgi:hypothetical protein